VTTALLVAYCTVGGAYAVASLQRHHVWLAELRSQVTTDRGRVEAEIATAAIATFLAVVWPVAVVLDLIDAKRRRVR
jgi:hypothetical protein